MKTLALSLTTFVLLICLSCGGGSSSAEQDAPEQSPAADQAKITESVEVCQLYGQIDLKALFNIADSTQIALVPGTSGNASCKAIWLSPDHLERKEAAAQAALAAAKARGQNPNATPTAGHSDTGEQILHVVYILPRSGEPKKALAALREMSATDRDGQPRELEEVDGLESAFFDVQLSQISFVSGPYLIHVHYSGDLDNKEGALRVALALTD